MQTRHPFVLIFSRLTLALGILALLALMGMQTLRASAATPAYIRVIHASPDVGTADVFVDGNILLSSFAFGSVTDYAPIPPGPHKVQIALVGKGIGAAAITQTLVVQPGGVYTAAAIGTKASGLSIEVFVDNNIIQAGKAKLRMYNLSPDAGPLSLTASGQGIINSLAYQQASSYLGLSTGSYSFDITGSSSSVSLPLSKSLGKNTVTSIFVVGLANGTPKIELSPAQVSGVPGVPNTGSDPNPLPLPDSAQPSPVMPWILSILALMLLGAAFISRRVTLSR